ncbi:class I SAM-dependent methyltransferase [Mesorhizobium sp. M0047]|uniref:class I SAM-dependent methyltransferase n=1 Tax=Mesorhizobium sp. M0047 TaxID=2956859 RepID=UPI003339B44A
MNKDPSPENTRDATPVDEPKARKAKPARRTCIMVLGMHRSGTSALTRVLNLLGAALPKNLIGAGLGNEGGHWEPTWIVDLNERLLAEAGGTWNKVISSGLDVIPTSVRQFYVEEIRRIVAAEFGDHTTIAIKDPRISRLLPIYSEALEGIGFQLKIVILVRDPDEVAASLFRRDAMSPDLAFETWLDHMLTAAHQSRAFVASVLSYQALLDDWRQAVEAIDVILGTSFMANAASAGEAVDNWLRREPVRQMPPYAESPMRSCAQQTYRLLESNKSIDLADIDAAGLAAANADWLRFSSRDPPSTKTEIGKVSASQIAYCQQTKSRGLDQMKTKSLDDIGRSRGTDKASNIHDYLSFYAEKFEPIRHESFVMFELGVFRGASVRMWADYFPNAKIVGVDYDPEARRYEGERISILIGNAAEEGFLRSIVERHGPPRIVIDDASHRWDHQILGLQTLFPLLVPGGQYVIEDIDTSFEQHLKNAPFQGESNISAIDYVYKLARCVVGDAALGSEQPYDTFIGNYYKSVNSIELYRRLALINKRANPRP